MNPHTPHPDEGPASADRPQTDRSDPDLPDAGQTAPDLPDAGQTARDLPDAGLPPADSSDAGRAAGAAAGSGPDVGPSPEPPRLYQAGDPEGPYGPPLYGTDPSQGGPYPGGPGMGGPGTGGPGMGGPYPAGQMPGRQGQNFFDWIRSQGIYRGRDRWIGGVASGIAHRLGVDPLIIRGVLIVLTIFAGVGVLAYGLAWALLPEPDGRIHVQEAAAGRWTAGMTGALITTVIGFPSLGTGVWGWDRFGFGAFVWTVFWVGGAIYLVYYLTQRNKTRNGATPMSSRYDSSSPAGTATYAGTAGADQHSAAGFPPAGIPAYGQPVNDAGSSGAGPVWGPPPPSGTTPPGPVPPGGYGPGPGATPPPAAPRSPGPGTPAVAITVGSALLVGGGIKALDAANLIDLGDSGNALVWAIAAAILGLGILFAGLRGRTSGILGFFAVVALLIGGIFSVVPHGDRFRFQNADWTPSSIEQARGGFEITGGKGTVDLTKMALNPPLGSDVVVPIDATASNLTVVIPGTVPVQVQADMTMANLHEGNQDHGGIMNQQSDYNTSKPGARMVLKISGTVSNVTIKEGN
ncbi:PspC domain-containing protein [Arthrobacter sp. NicSoilB8]|uniref:PspC domain-containing protein n=1 Tax=Arthrobacter sp. NicSoilB8 TaxID=2830998 RepID=UPI001CC7715F|nr:PspC domain-containing protein [Arthrobacter sp. NicSoilB8]BCW72360.1 hypothetical protein NicSoilB8_34040 [Arthrobacter sp. NicSoilB8]